MYRFILCIEYDGSNYHGWQRQKSITLTIQEKVENALSCIADENISVICAGRTDKGVHALYQIIHFDCSKKRNLSAWVEGTNSLLPRDIRVLWAKDFTSMHNFNARKSALIRHYKYFILNSKVSSGLLHKNITWKRQILDVERMNSAAKSWLGEHDFSSFRSSDCQSISPIRKVYLSQVTRSDNLLIFDIIANSFLHHMVRNMVGVLIKIGQGINSVSWSNEVLIMRDNKIDIISPANGLYLVNVKYPKKYNIIGNLNNIPWFFKTKTKEFDEEELV